MTRKLFTVFLAAMIAGTPFSCAMQEPEEARNETGRADDEQAVDRDRVEEELGASAEVRELLGILADAAARLRMRGLTAADLARLQGEAPEAATDALGYSADETVVLRQRLEALCGALRARYPALDALADAGAEAAPSPGDRILFDDTLELPVDPSLKGAVTCRWLPFVVALSACAQATIASGGNPVVYFVCAFQALCSYCLGGWVSDACN